MNIKVKFVLASMLIFLLATLGISVYMYHEYTGTYLQQTETTNQQLLNQLSYNLDVYLDEIYRLTLAPYYNANVMDELVNRAPEDPREKLTKRRIIEDFLDGTMIYPRTDIQSVLIVSDDRYFSYRSSGYFPSYKDLVGSQWYQDTLAGSGARVLLPHELEQFYQQDARSYFSIVNSIRVIQGKHYQTIGVIRVDANFRTIENLCQQVQTGTGVRVSILSADGSVIYRSPGDAPENEGLVSTVRLSHFGWQVVLEDSLESLQEQFLHTRYRTFGVGLAVLLLTMLFLYKCMNFMFRPLYQTVDFIQTVENDETISTRLQLRGRDEITHLSEALNRMLDRLQAMLGKNIQLTSEIYREKLISDETQLQLLQGQIRPHFIYNTLNMISIQVQKGDSQQAIKNINRMSQFLRGIAYINRDIALELELELTEAYLAIQQERFDGRLHYQIDIPESFLPMMVPALLLQPIVENAVLHGYEFSQKEMTVRIAGKTVEDSVQIIVANNGSVIPPDVLKNLQERLQEGYSTGQVDIGDFSQMKGMGLMNVQWRIQIKCGKQYGLYVASSAQTGTVVTIRLPPL